jgi:hypothetical protein
MGKNIIAAKLIFPISFISPNDSAKGIPTELWKRDKKTKDVEPTTGFFCFMRLYRLQIFIPYGNNIKYLIRNSYKLLLIMEVVLGTP